MLFSAILLSKLVPFRHKLRLQHHFSSTPSGFNFCDEPASTLCIMRNRARASPPWSCPVPQPSIPQASIDFLSRPTLFSAIVQARALSITISLSPRHLPTSASTFATSHAKSSARFSYLVISRDSCATAFDASGFHSRLQLRPATTSTKSGPFVNPHTPMSGCIRRSVVRLKTQRRRYCE